MEPIHNKLHQPFSVLNDPIIDVLNDFCSQISPHLVNCELENRGDGDLVWQPKKLFFQVEVSLQKSHESFQHYRDIYKLKLHKSKNAYKVLYSRYVVHLEKIFNLSDELNFSDHSFQDPFTCLLESSVKVDFDLFTNEKNRFSLRFEFPFYFFFYLLKVTVSRTQSSSHFLDWIHWRKGIT